MGKVSFSPGYYGWNEYRNWYLVQDTIQIVEGVKHVCMLSDSNRHGAPSDKCLFKSEARLLLKLIPVSLGLPC